MNNRITKQPEKPSNVAAISISKFFYALNSQVLFPKVHRNDLNLPLDIPQT